MNNPSFELTGVVPSVCDAEAGACPDDRVAAGAHIITPRGPYDHHGIYVGNGVVVHYAGLAHGLRAGPIEAVSMDQFTQGRPLQVLIESSPRFSSAEIVQRALSRVGENRYHFLKNNCEHFCEWCLRAEPRSYQVDRLLSWPLRALEYLIGRFMQVTATDARSP